MNPILGLLVINFSSSSSSFFLLLLLFPLKVSRLLIGQSANLNEGLDLEFVLSEKTELRGSATRGEVGEWGEWVQVEESKEGLKGEMVNGEGGTSAETEDGQLRKLWKENRQWKMSHDGY